MTKHLINITHLYPDLMNIYGDIGNVIALKKRAEWRGLKVRINNVHLNEPIPKQTDLYFMGGGQDRDQMKIYKDFLDKKNRLAKDIEANKPFLAVCGALQLLGKFFVSGEGEKITGLGILDLKTVAPSNTVQDRCIGNIAAKLNDRFIDKNKISIETIVGFENHIGQTILGNKVKALGYVLEGDGNNKRDKTEGVLYKNTLGTYLHGSFLPKNPHIADFLLKQALLVKYDDLQDLNDLDNTEEFAAHQYILKQLQL